MENNLENSVGPVLSRSHMEIAVARAALIMSCMCLKVTYDRTQLKKIKKHGRNFVLFHMCEQVTCLQIEPLVLPTIQKAKVFFIHFHKIHTSSLIHFILRITYKNYLGENKMRLSDWQRLREGHCLCVTFAVKTKERRFIIRLTKLGSLINGPDNAPLLCIFSP